MMEQENEFYIGWQEHAPSSFKSSRKGFFIITLIVAIIFGITYLFIERPFIESTFDFGNLTELEGTLVEYPVFGLKTSIDDQTVTVPLVGFGKFDALPVLDRIRSEAGDTPLEKLKVKLRGTIIQYRDRMWMELTEGNGSIIEVNTMDHLPERIINNKGTKTVIGEIIDPKCFFGVMNPAYGKIHKSCAIRCISGGIPPVLAVGEHGEFSDYYFLVDQQGHSVNKEVLAYVGIPVSLSGDVQQVDDWNVIKISPGELQTSVLIKLDNSFAYCF
ncbi:hypothetical protein FNH22_00130 [Fulvivirga sp. M361]|uniref:hypothetical protein n=1 Tax=Fulvivirga sp. M361 TaxID=2594266 RepID=UPI00117B9B59|nr:hypothetical protein [Fulvivirga sp. M361]TRX62538.1 hypothetical protein FNH22_00130 [Fulvivirga sp. M361]